MPIRTHPVDKLTRSIRPQSFRLITSCNISRPNVRSATIRFSRLFSSSRSRNRRISEGIRPHTFFPIEIRSGTNSRLAANLRDHRTLIVLLNNKRLLGVRGFGCFHCFHSFPARKVAVGDSSSKRSSLLEAEQAPNHDISRLCSNGLQRTQIYRCCRTRRRTKGLGTMDFN